MLVTTLGDMARLSLGKYDGTELGSTDGTIDVEFEVLLLVDSLGSLYVLEVGCNEDTELWIYDGRLLGTTLGTYDGTEVGLSYCSSTADGKFEGAVYGIELGTNEGINIVLRYGRVIGTILGDMDGLPLGTYDGSYIGLS